MLNLQLLFHSLPAGGANLSVSNIHAVNKRQLNPEPTSILEAKAAVWGSNENNMSKYSIKEQQTRKKLMKQVAMLSVN